jgi:hypothetical protein
LETTPLEDHLNVGRPKLARKSAKYETASIAHNSNRAQI